MKMFIKMGLLHILQILRHTCQNCFIKVRYCFIKARFCFITVVSGCWVIFMHVKDIAFQGNFEPSVMLIVALLPKAIYRLKIHDCRLFSISFHNCRQFSYELINCLPFSIDLFSAVFHRNDNLSAIFQGPIFGRFLRPHFRQK